MQWYTMTNKNLMICNDIQMLWYAISMLFYGVYCKIILDLTVNVFVISVFYCIHTELRMFSNYIKLPIQQNSLTKENHQVQLQSFNISHHA